MQEAAKRKEICLLIPRRRIRLAFPHSAEHHGLPFLGSGLPSRMSLVASNFPAALRSERLLVSSRHRV